MTVEQQPIESDVEALVPMISTALATAGDLLIIEDDPEIVTMLVWFLQVEEALAVHAAFNSEQALRRISPKPPALVLLDLTIPGEQCAASIAKLRACRPGAGADCAVLRPGKRCQRRPGTRRRHRPPQTIRSRRAGDDCPSLRAASAYTLRGLMNRAPHDIVLACTI